MGNKKSTFNLEDVSKDASARFSIADDVASTVSGLSISTISSSKRSKGEKSDLLSLYESPEERKKRHQSHYVAYASMGIMTIGFSIVLGGTWPYLRELTGKDNLQKTSLGWVTAANPLGQVIASPIAGMVSNKLREVRRPCYFALTCYILSYLLYGLLPFCTDLWTDSAYHLMILSRFLSGLSGGSITLWRSYIAASTTDEERTKGMSFLSVSQSGSFIFGPIIQMILTLTVEDDLYKYSIGGYIAVAVGVFNLILISPLIFKEHRIADKEIELKKLKGHPEDEPIEFKRDKIAISGLLISIFFCMVFFVFMETLSVPFFIDMYGWEDDFVVIVFSVMILASGIVAMIALFVGNRLAKKIQERNVLILMGYVCVFLGMFLLLPIYSDEPMVLAECTNATTDASHHDATTQSAIPLLTSLIMGKSEDDSDDIECTPGCPPSQEWCETVPRLPYVQLGFAEFFVFIGYPVVMAFTFGLYSRCLGPKPQGLWMALLSEILSLSRLVGPIVGTYLYTYLGPVWGFSILSVGMIGCITMMVFVRKRLPTIKRR